MNDIGGRALGLSLIVTLFVFTGIGAERLAKNSETMRGEAIATHIAILRAGKSQEKAAAAYWLGQQHAAAAEAVTPLVELLGDATLVNPAQYRLSRVLQKLTLGEEAAAALVNIGHPSIEPLIRVLKTSPTPEARKNAAWALGALHETGATSAEI
jgi:HEAT repeat protein